MLLFIFFFKRTETVFLYKYNSIIKTLLENHDMLFILEFYPLLLNIFLDNMIKYLIFKNMF